MRNDITVIAEPRSERGKNEARRTRVAGRIPAIVYGAGKDSTAVSVDPKEIDRIMYSKTGHNTIFNVQIKGQEDCPAMIVAWQHHPFKEHLLHVDLGRIDLTKKLTVKVAVQLEGEPRGMKLEGGLLEVVTREVQLECLPQDIPESISADISHLMIGDGLRISDLSFEDSVTLVDNPANLICQVVAMKAVEEEEEEDVEEEGVEGEEPAEGSTEAKDSKDSKESKEPKE